MDEIFKIAEVGMPVFIVGALVPLDKLRGRGTIRPDR